MSDSLEGLRRQLGAAGDLKSVVRAMKALAASSLGQYERSVMSLRDYFRTIEQGLHVCLRHSMANGISLPHPPAKPTQGIVIFGSDQGLVGQFNEVIIEFLEAQKLSTAGKVWAVGERVETRMEELGYKEVQCFDLPNSIQAIAPLIGRILVSIEAFQEKSGGLDLHILHHCPKVGASYEPVCRQVLPIDAVWSRQLGEMKWPTNQIPQTVGPWISSFQALLKEYIFVSLFQACAESLASENASRLAGMQRAEKNIEELSGDLNRRFHRLRQSSIDEELFDVVAGFEALSPPGKSGR